MDSALTQTPEFILCVQHGWADNNRAMQSLAQALVADTIPVVAPNLGYVQTWVRITPLIQKVEAIASHLLIDPAYSSCPLRIVGHSMGGLIWLEVLHRHPEWWSRIHSLVLVASPVGGADLGRLIDPLGLGIGIAADLGKNRRTIAAEIAHHVPTLVIAGDIHHGSDGTIPVSSTRFAHAQFVCLSGLSHPVLRDHPQVALTIQDFWADFAIGESIEFSAIVQRLHAVPGMTDGHRRDFDKARVIMRLTNGGTIRFWRNPFGIDHIFVGSATGDCVYAGFVGWFHAADLQKALQDIQGLAQVQ